MIRFSIHGKSTDDAKVRIIPTSVHHPKGFIFRDEETVRTYRRNLLIKLNAKNTPEAVKKGYEMKLIW